MQCAAGKLSHSIDAAVNFSCLSPLGRHVSPIPIGLRTSVACNFLGWRPQPDPVDFRKPRGAAEAMRWEGSCRGPAGISRRQTSRIASVNNEPMIVAGFMEDNGVLLRFSRMLHLAPGWHNLKQCLLVKSLQY